MNSNTVIFYLIIFLVINSVIIVNIHNTVSSLLVLMLNFILSSLILYLLNCEFLALMFLIVYVGAIMVLFLFLLMLLDMKFKNLLNLTNHLKLYFLVLLMPLIVSTTELGKKLFLYNNLIFESLKFIDWRLLSNSTYNVNIYSIFLYGNSVLEFLIIGLILLLALIGIIYIINNYISSDSKFQISTRQSSIRSRFFY